MVARSLGLSLGLGLSLSLNLAASHKHQHHHRSGGSNAGEDGAKAGAFEDWIFALEWQPQWIEGHCNDGGGKLGANFFPDSYGATHLSLHGLWPNYIADQHDGKSWPQFCAGADGNDYTQCKSSGGPDFCYPNAAALEAFNVTDRWMKYALEYSWTELASHEWAKHGGCTGWNQTYFFRVAEQTYSKLAEGPGFDFIADNVGKSVAHEDLVKAFSSGLDGKSPGFQCAKNCELSEVWTKFAADPETLLPAAPMDHSDEDSCGKCDAVKITKFDGCDAPADTCVAGQQGPTCAYDPATANTDADPCKAHQDCVRCAKSDHGGTHYCTSAPL
uniref:Uncharacterized protein n=2 Tax=Phaeomonas parva TaxID=124430 RepID=A0A7S1TQJ6_9STRA|mmetsp:Transcript_11412/g.34643  ORF Transcript_11412/g.34643 Transcript_11412/m.34643 type:complete len:330 (+) Transcript_11412:167-1156(+)